MSLGYTWAVFFRRLAVTHTFGETFLFTLSYKTNTLDFRRLAATQTFGEMFLHTLWYKINTSTDKSKPAQ